MDNCLGREESGIIMLGSLVEDCLLSKRWVRSASSDSKKVTRWLQNPLGFLDRMQALIFISSTEETPYLINIPGSLSGSL